MQWFNMGGIRYRPAPVHMSPPATCQLQRTSFRDSPLQGRFLPQIPNRARERHRRFCETALEDTRRPVVRPSR